MRAFEFKTPQSTTELADLLDKAKDKPKALNMLATGIDAILIATNKLLSKVKANEKNVVQEPKPVPKPVPTPAPPAAPASPAIPNTNQIAKTESLEETTIQDIPSLKSKIDGIESNIKLLKTLKLGKQAILIVKQLEAQINEFEEEIKNALKEATDSYKSLDPYISNMLSKVNENNEQSIARARSIFLNDEIPIEEAKRFLEVAQTGVIDMIPMVKKSKGKLDQFVVNDPVVKRVYAKVIADFINWIPGKTAGNVGPGEFALVMLGNPTGKEKKGDLKIGDEMFEVKAGNTSRAELKTGKLGTPKRTGAIFDTGISGKAVWPEIEEILVSYGFKNMTERKKDAEGNTKKYTRYNLQANNFENYNQEFDRLGMNLSARAELLTKISKKIFPASTFDIKLVKKSIQAILMQTNGKLTPATVPPGESNQLQNNNMLLRYLNTLSLQTYREEGSSKDNFLFLNKTTREYRVYRGQQLDKELNNPLSDLKLISGIAFSLVDKQSKATPRITLG